MPFPVAVVRFGKVIEIVEHRGQEIKRDRHPEDNTARLINIAGRPDIKVGNPWPFCTVAEALASGTLEKAPHPRDPHALRVPATTEGSN